MLIETSTTWVTGRTHVHVQFYAVLSNVILTRGARCKRIIEVMMLNRSCARRDLSTTDHGHINCWSLQLHRRCSTHSPSWVLKNVCEEAHKSLDVKCSGFDATRRDRHLDWSHDDLATLRLPESCRVLITPNLTKPHADHRNSNFTLNLSATQSKWGTTLRSMDISPPGI
jgi:hypothetical protein